MKETFLIKHAVGGRTFVDTAKQSVPYQIHQDGEEWLFEVQAPLDEAMQELLAWKDELNVFVFREFENEPTLKIWYYVKQGSVQYNEQKAALTFAASSKLEYVPDKFSGNY
ncbi:hypothetical protein [Paenibacillus hexagrammi]|uniref:Uncharacterized protein n=1 Tax=Paenibacillus hexagrammi TaxID=2908839 RepID=A0ABY3SMA8_9BACL|nr:hypothetical protein [Paenibacillus sp. YPD9-1]UJF34092.1 hypothetical protein L0M14_02310 [Paenibacillus sp. YPD9-1]